jgi:hypothetical protein
MTWNRSRVLAVGGLAAGLAAFLVAVLSAVGAPDGGVSSAKAADATITSRTVAIGAARVQVTALPTGTCFTVSDRDGSAHACPARTGAPDIGFAETTHGIGGIAGSEVVAVIVRLTHRGTVWATLKQGVFYTAVPPGHQVRLVVKLLRGGSRTAFAA